MTNMEKKTIWDENDFIALEDIQEDYPDYSASELAQIAADMLYERLEDERANLDIEVDRTIVCLADLGFWNGRRKAWKVMGSNINDILHRQLDDSYCHWFYDPETENICGSEAHHDNTHQYIYRMVDDDTLEVAQEGEVPNVYDYLMMHSQSIAEPVKKVYGW